MSADDLVTVFEGDLDLRQDGFNPDGSPRFISGPGFPIAKKVELSFGTGVRFETLADERARIARGGRQTVRRSTLNSVSKGAK